MNNLPQQPRGASRSGDLEILEERVMVSIPRGDEELRFTFTRARSGDGKELAWHSLRVFWKTDEGEWRPGKAGITIRARELKPICEALLKATTGALPGPAAAPAAAHRELMPDEEYARRRGREPR